MKADPESVYGIFQSLDLSTDLHKNTIFIVNIFSGYFK